MKAMNDSSKFDLTDEMDLTDDISDEALETAAGAVKRLRNLIPASICSYGVAFVAISALKCGAMQWS
jgi:hypothetical protein